MKQVGNSSLFWEVKIIGIKEDGRSIVTPVAGQLGLKSTRPLSQLGPGSTQPESSRPGVFSEHSVTYIWFGLYMYNLSD